MASSGWHKELEESQVVFIIMGEDYYGSRGEERLTLAVKLRKPVVLINILERNLAVPTVFTTYYGQKLLISCPTKEHIPDNQITLLKAALRHWGLEGKVNIYEDEYDKSR